MAVTQNTYTGNGSTVLFSFTFPYLDITDIKVSLNGTVTTAYTLANATTVQTNAAPAVGVAIRIYRDTDIDDNSATFFPGSSIRSEDLNQNFDQILYATQETRTLSESTATTANGIAGTANTALSNSSAAVATANTASGNATTALNTANTASSNATTALNTANTAAGNASTALSTANTASSTATTASSNATAAVTTANAADSKADTAIAAVSSVVPYVPVANVAAIPASPANDTYIEVADSTGIQSFTPLAGMPAGFIGDAGLSVRLRYTSTGTTWNWLGYVPNNSDTRYLKKAVGAIVNADVNASAGIVASKLSFTQAGTGATARTIDSKLKDVVSVKDFGAVGDGVADDTAAIQAAINYCATFSRWATLVLTGRHKITSSLIVDRLVDTTLSEFRIVANGPGAGFYVAGNVTVFDSTISVTTDPKSEWVTFEGVTFESSSFFDQAYVLSQKFLRCKFLNCYFKLFRCQTSTIYAQTLFFQNCNIRNSQSGFIDCVGLYDVVFDSCIIENNYRLVRCIDAVRGTNGLRIVNSVIEGQQETTLAINGAAGFVYAHNHVEANPANDLNFFAGGMQSKSITIVGNYVFNPAGALCYYGPTDQVFSAGNCVSGTIHSNAVQITNLTSISDSAATIADATITSKVNGVVRYGAAQEDWTHSANHFTKSAAGNFGFGRAPVSVVRAAFQGSDQTSSNYATVAYDSVGNAIFLARNDRVFMLPVLNNQVDDAAAATAGIPIGGLYRNGSVVQVRVT